MGSVTHIRPTTEERLLTLRRLFFNLQNPQTNQNCGLTAQSARLLMSSHGHMAIQLWLVAACLAALVRPPFFQVSAGVILLQSSDSSDYDFLGEFTALNITVLRLRWDRLGFRGVLDTLQREFSQVDKIAVVGSGDRFLDAFAAFVADTLSLPFIDLGKLHLWPVRRSNTTEINLCHSSPSPRRPKLVEPLALDNGQGYSVIFVMVAYSIERLLADRCGWRQT